MTAGDLTQALAWLRSRLTAEIFDEARPAPPAPVDIVVRRAAGRRVHGAPAAAAGRGRSCRIGR